MAVLSSFGLYGRFIELGLATKHTRRLVIDVTIGEAPIIYREDFGDERLLDVAEALSRVSIDYRAAPSTEDSSHEPTAQQPSA
jgi:hypothetical protein